MKKWFAYSLLVALTLLLVPRSWVHDCDHDHIEADSSDSDTDHENCFVCELDLENGTAIVLPEFNFDKNDVQKPVAEEIESLPLPSFDLYNHRGPPVSC